MVETMVRMGEYAVSATADELLVSVGLGSCIGLVLLDRRAAAAGLAHVVLPAAGGDVAAPGKFADTAVHALIAGLERLGARPARLEAVLVGGASMFPPGAGSLDIGERNYAAVREQLARVRIPVSAAETGGSRGRTVRVALATGRVTAHAAGAPEQELHPGWLAAPPRPARPAIASPPAPGASSEQRP